jgi:hypothetical protein
MSSKIDITLHDVELEVEIETTPPEPENGIQGGFDIIAVTVLDRDIWPILRVYPKIEADIVAAIEKLWENDDV